ncbi:metallophosphoesterase family protein [Rhodopila sp.]|uniref:metallophosphoesterase family protein n=1 Tax=Rhodopila sp. TaxID=2480087 RepID=UPI003D114510
MPSCATSAAETFEIAPEAGGLDRTTQIQPGVYFTFEAPFVRILALYSNALEDPGVISSHGGEFPELTDVQLTYLHTALERVKSENFSGAVIIAHHHPAYTIAGERGHGSSTDMRKQIDAICQEVAIWPHAVLSAHAHNYQRYTRTMADMQIPYLIAGGGGHSRPQKLTRANQPALRTPLTIATDADMVVLENYDDTDTGYLRIVATAPQLRIEYHPSSDSNVAKTPDDQVTVDLATRKIVHFTG